jgi:hypothetical protein
LDSGWLTMSFPVARTALFVNFFYEFSARMQVLKSRGVPPALPGWQ